MSESEVCPVTQRKELQVDQAPKVQEVKKEETAYQEVKAYRDLKVIKEGQEDSVPSVVMELKETRVIMAKTEGMAFQVNQGFKEELAYLVIWGMMEDQGHPDHLVSRYS